MSENRMKGYGTGLYGINKRGNAKKNQQHSPLAKWGIR
jgi:hypothetical protein